MVKINKPLLPVKAHYFFFMAAMGPILPQISVFGKQLGIPPDTMGYITSVLPILYVLAKPAVGLLADYFSSLRKFIFVTLIITMSLCFAGFYFIPHNTHTIDKDSVLNFTVFTKDIPYCEDEVTIRETTCTKSREMNCRNESGYLIPRAYVMTIDPVKDSKFAPFISETDNKTYHFCLERGRPFGLTDPILHEFSCKSEPEYVPYCGEDKAFWLYVVLLCLGTIGFNVTNCISDAICFDVLGADQEMKYGAQRVWGTIGFGVTALLGGIAVDLWTTDAVKSFTPALIVMLVFSGFDLLSAAKLKLPKLSSDSIFRDVWGLVRQRQVAVFLVFATLAGILDSFIIYFMFWHLEEVAERTGYMASIKLIEGCVVAAECLCGEIPMFLFSGKIIKKIGYVHCLSLCFFMYAVRLALISLIPNPWWLVGVEMVMQGCTYALTYTCIVAYASAIAPPGTSATVQGLVAGMDDGLGYAIGSLIGGKAYKFFGGARSFQAFSGAAVVACICHIWLRPASKDETHKPKVPDYAVPSEQFKVDEKS